MGERVGGWRRRHPEESETQLYTVRHGTNHGKRPQAKRGRANKHQEQRPKKEKGNARMKKVCAEKRESETQTEESNTKEIYKSRYIDRYI